MKMIIIKNCTECNRCEWIGGKPRCTHPEIKQNEPDNVNDFCLYPRVYNDGTKDFLDDCPLNNSKDIEQFILDQFEKTISSKDNYGNDLVDMGVEIGKIKMIGIIGEFIGIDKEKLAEIQGMYAND